MRIKLRVGVILVCVAAWSTVAGKKPSGRVLDAATLSKVRTYCIQTSDAYDMPNSSGGPLFRLEDPKGDDLRDLVKRESGPKGLLSKLPWKLEADCSAPAVDAILRFDFHRRFTDRRDPYWSADMQVSDKASSQVIYKSNGENTIDYPLHTPFSTEVDHTLRNELAVVALRDLVSDVKAISKNP